MADWRARVDRLLYDGEVVEAQAGGDDAGVVVTTHRVHAFTPGTDGANYRAVDRPNATGVTRRTGGSRRWLVAGVEALLAGALLAGGSLLVNFDGAVSGVGIARGQGAEALGGILGLLALARTAFGLLDDVLRLTGAVALLVGVAGVAAYLASREERLVVGVAGDEDLALPAGAFSAADVSEVATALGGDGDRSTERRAVDGSG